MKTTENTQIEKLKKLLDSEKRKNGKLLKRIEELEKALSESILFESMAEEDSEDMDREQCILLMENERLVRRLAEKDGLEVGDDGHKTLEDTGFGDMRYQYRNLSNTEWEMRYWMLFDLLKEMHKSKALI